MLSNSFSLSAVELLAAVKDSKSFKRRPANTNASVPNDTLLTPNDASSILVEAPMKTSKLMVDGDLKVQISIDARLFEQAVAIQKDARSISIWYDDTTLFVEGKTRVSVPRNL